jgi:hypothetical protein
LCRLSARNLFVSFSKLVDMSLVMALSIPEDRAGGGRGVAKAPRLEGPGAGSVDATTGAAAGPWSCVVRARNASELFLIFDAADLERLKLGGV